MASVIASEVSSNRLLADGRRRIRYTYTVEDNQSVVEVFHPGPLQRPGEWDADGNLADYANHFFQQMQDQEDARACDVLLRGDSLAITLGPRFSSAKRVAKKLIRWMMMERDPRIVLWLEPLIVYLRANYTNTQLLSFLGLTAAQGTKMNKRINSILNNPGSVKSVKTLLSEFDAEEGELE